MNAAVPGSEWYSLALPSVKIRVSSVAKNLLAERKSYQLAGWPYIASASTTLKNGLEDLSHGAKKAATYSIRQRHNEAGTMLYRLDSK